MRKERKHFTPEEKIAILKRHLVDKVPVSELCEPPGSNDRSAASKPQETRA
jgi:transposase